MGDSTCEKSLGSCECMFIRTKFGIVLVCVHVDRVGDRLIVCRFGQSFGSC